MKLLELNQHIVLKPQPQLDAQGGYDLKQQVSALVAEQYPLWIVDLAEVDFIDSSGLGALVSTLKLARRQGCRLVLCHPSATVRLIFEITQLDRVFEIFDELEAVFSESETPLSA